MSAMEHLVPEQMFSTEAAPAKGISAVKAIQLAAAEGQRIYTITRANVDVALAQINLSSDIEAEIRNAALSIAFAVLSLVQIGHVFVSFM